MPANDAVHAGRRPLSPPRYYPRKTSRSPQKEKSLYAQPEHANTRLTTLSDHFVRSGSYLQTVTPPTNYSQDRSKDVTEDEISDKRSVYVTEQPVLNKYPKKGHFSPYLVYDDDNSHNSGTKDHSEYKSISKEVNLVRNKSRSPQKDLRFNLMSKSAGRHIKERSVTPLKR